MGGDCIIATTKLKLKNHGFFHVLFRSSCLFAAEVTVLNHPISQVPRHFTPAFFRDPSTLTCKAPSVVPSPSPARPRARLGLMLNLRFDASGAPENLDEVHLYNAYKGHHIS